MFGLQKNLLILFQVNFCGLQRRYRRIPVKTRTREINAPENVKAFSENTKKSGDNHKG